MPTKHFFSCHKVFVEKEEKKKEENHNKNEKEKRKRNKLAIPANMPIFRAVYDVVNNQITLGAIRKQLHREGNKLKRYHSGAD